MLGARLEDLALGLCHGILDLDNITGLWSARIQFKLPLPTVRGEVKTLDSRIDRFSSSVDDKLPPFQENPSRTPRNLEAHHENRVLLLTSHILHIED